MKEHIVLFTCFLSLVQSGRYTQAHTRDNQLDGDKPSALKLVITSLEVDTKSLRLNYEITNNSTQDAWICDEIAEGCSFEVYMDDETIMVRRRLDVPTSVDFLMYPIGKYGRLGAGRKRNESLLLDMPITPSHMYSDSAEQLRDTVNATSLSVEIGYHLGNFPEMLFNVGEGDLTIARSLSSMNESLRHREEEVLFGYIYPQFQAERVLLATISDLNILYKEKQRKRYHIPPDLASCTKIEIQYEPSLLDYAYPYKYQQRLLNNREIEYLRSQKTAVTDNALNISVLANDLRKAPRSQVGVFSDTSKARVVAYEKNQRLASFIVYDDTVILTEKNQTIKFANELQSFRKLSSQIEPFDLRMQCAANLKNLWYRLRFYEPIYQNDQSAKNRAVYPPPSQWCDDLKQRYARDTGKVQLKKVYVCPSAGEGKNHYAMNANCRPDSSPNMVLLFETKAGWNQHGGPELFTFGNHDPKGGCVLLKDGTVKFIRTKEELQKLRWK